MIVLAFGFPLINPATATFSDVPVGSPFFTFVETAVVAGHHQRLQRRHLPAVHDVTRGQLTKMVAHRWDLDHRSRPPAAHLPRRADFG